MLEFLYTIPNGTLILLIYKIRGYYGTKGFQYTKTNALNSLATILEYWNRVQFLIDPKLPVGKRV